MKGRPINKIMLDTFQEILEQAFCEYCETYHSEPLPGNLITYLIDQDLIPETVIRKFTIQEEFDRLFGQDQAKKSRIVYTLATKYHLSERTIWTILRKKREEV